MVLRDEGGKLRRSATGLVPPLLALALWLGVLSWWTSGFSAFTTFSHTLLAAGPLPRTAPSFSIRDQFGVEHETAAFAGKHVLLQFAYFSCTDVCPLLMADYHLLHRELGSRMPEEFLLLTVSFDPARDTTERLYNTWHHHGQPAGWYVAALTTPLDDISRAELQSLGVWVSGRDDSKFNHSAQSFLLDPAGQVVEVFDSPGSSSQMVAALEERLL